MLTGEDGPELRHENKAGFIAHNRALRGMVAMAARLRAIAGSGATGARFDTAPAPVPALAAIAAITPAGATRTGTQITYAPVTHLPSPTCPRCTSSAGSM